MAAASPSHKNLMRLQYRAGQLQVDALATRGELTIIEPTNHGPKLWAYRATQEEAARILDLIAEARGRVLPPVQLVAA